MKFKDCAKFFLAENNNTRTEKIFSTSYHQFDVIKFNLDLTINQILF